jgi:hypothetical protein
VDKIKRDAFLYMAPARVSQNDAFAQCSSCRMFVPPKGCLVLGSRFPVSADDGTCGVYIAWPPGDKPDKKAVAEHTRQLAAGLPATFTPEEVGYVERQVRCENCTYFKKAAYQCGLYLALNKAMPMMFDLDPDVDQYGCCNANTAPDSAASIQRAA